MTTCNALQTLCAADLMQRDLITVHVDDPLREVERVLVDAQVSSVPVLDDSGAVLGVVSMRDVVSSHADSDGDPDPIDDDDGGLEWSLRNHPTAGELMSTDMLRVAPETTVPEMAQVMVDNACHRVLVVKRGRLVGLVSSMDVLRSIASSAERG